MRILSSANFVSQRPRNPANKSKVFDNRKSQPAHQQKILLDSSDLHLANASKYGAKPKSPLQMKSAKAHQATE